MPFGDRKVAATMVVIAVIAQTIFMGPAVVLLDCALLISLLLWLAASPTEASATRVLPVFIVAIVVQLIHFAEEYRMGFHTEFPALFGYSWEARRFVAFNVAWLLLFAASAAAVAARQRIGYLGALFLAIAGIGNGIGHLALAARSNAYFPGVYTAPASLIIGAMLLHRLLSGRG
jgi:hypothetical protein